MQASTRFALNAASNWGNTFVTIAAGAVTVPYAVARLGDVPYGIYGVLGSILAMLGLLELGLSAGLARFSCRDQAAGDEQALRETISTGQAILGAVGLVGACAMVAGTPWIRTFFRVPEEYAADLLRINVCLAVSYALSFIALATKGVVMGANRHDLANLVEIVATLVRVGLMFGLFEAWRASLVLFGVTFVAHQVVRLVGLQAAARVSVGRAASFRLSAVSRRSFTRLAGFSSYNALMVLGNLVLLQGPNFIIGRMLGTAMVTAFAPALLVASQLRGFVMGLTSPIMPLAGREAVTAGGARLGEWSVRLSRFSCVVSLTLILPILLYAGPILKGWMGPGFEWTAPVFVVTVVGHLFAGVQSANYYLVLGAASIRPWAISQMITAAVAMALAIIGQVLLGWGLLGIAASVAVVTAIRNGIYLPLFSCREFRVPLVHYFFETYGRPLLPALLVAAVAVVLSRWVPPVRLSLLAGHATLAMVLYAAAAWFLAMDSNDRDLLAGWVRIGVAKVRALRRSSGAASG